MQERQRIGETLRAARLAKGVSLEEAAAATRIRRSALQALETDEYDALPASVYTRGFLVTYTRYLACIRQRLSKNTTDSNANSPSLKCRQRRRKSPAGSFRYSVPRSSGPSYSSLFLA